MYSPACRMRYSRPSHFPGQAGRYSDAHALTLLRSSGLLLGYFRRRWLRLAAKGSKTWASAGQFLLEAEKHVLQQDTKPVKRDTQLKQVPTASVSLSPHPSQPRCKAHAQQQNFRSCEFERCSWNCVESMPCARVLVKTTVLAGMLMPIAKVSVENRTLMRDS